MLPSSSQIKRVRHELKAVGVGRFGRAKFVSHFLPQILYPDEHIKAAVFGRYMESTGLLRLEEGMLIATDKRIIFLDRKPGYESMDELTYDIVSGISKTFAWPFAAMTLHTKMGDYTLRFANNTCMDKFMDHVERRRLITSNGDAAPPAGLEVQESPQLEKDVLAFLNAHDTGVLSTVDRQGNAHGAVVHYLTVHDSVVCVLTKTETQKARNAFAHKQVALTVYDETTMETVQLLGAAVLEANQTLRGQVFAKLSKPRVYGEALKYPPVTALQYGSYVVMRIIPYMARLLRFDPH